MQSETKLKTYIICQPGRADRQFKSSAAAIRHLVSSVCGKLFADGKLILSKGFLQDTLH
jgi:hypothetical protein